MVDVVTIGETLGLMRSERGESVEMASALRLHVGGAESNVAIGVSRLGATSRWIGRVGDDDLGRRVVRELRAEGVWTNAIVDDTALTGVMLREYKAVGPSYVRYYRGRSAGSRLREEDIEADLIADAAILHVTGITPSLSVTAEAAIMRSVDLADGLDIPIAFDVNHRTTIERHRPAVDIYRAIAERSRIVFAGEDEASLLVPRARSRKDLISGLLDLGPDEVVLKLGDEGCLACIDGEMLSLPAVPVDVADTVGAGDAFVAGYLAERAVGASPHDRLTTAVGCGAFACAAPGDWEGAARRADLATLTRDGLDPVSR